MSKLYLSTNFNIYTHVLQVCTYKSNNYRAMHENIQSGTSVQPEKHYIRIYFRILNSSTRKHAQV